MVYSLQHQSQDVSPPSSFPSSKLNSLHSMSCESDLNCCRLMSWSVLISPFHWYSLQNRRGIHSVWMNQCSKTRIKSAFLYFSPSTRFMWSILKFFPPACLQSICWARIVHFVKQILLVSQSCFVSLYRLLHDPPTPFPSLFPSLSLSKPPLLFLTKHCPVSPTAGCSITGVTSKQALPTFQYVSLRFSVVQVPVLITMKNAMLRDLTPCTKTKN
jgi:hypothetical protein